MKDKILNVEIKIVKETGFNNKEEWIENLKKLGSW